MKNNKGITLIALVVTIIILLILAGISIAMLTGDNGILTNAKKTSTQDAYYSAEEQFNLAYMAVRTEIMAQTVSRGTYAPVKDIAHLASVVKADLNSSDWEIAYKKGAGTDTADDVVGYIYVKYTSSKIDKHQISDTLPKQESQVCGVITVKNQVAAKAAQGSNPATPAQKQTCTKEFDTESAKEGKLLTAASPDGQGATACTSTTTATYTD